MHTHASARRAYRILKGVFVILPLAAGADKFFNVLTNWENYLSPTFAHLIPFSTTAFMYLVGVIEIIAAIIVWSRWTRVGAYLITAWLLLVALNLIFGGYYDIAVRDIALACSAYALAELADAPAAHSFA